MSTSSAAFVHRLLVTCALLVFVAAVPALEIDDTHLLNPKWPPHARLHEAWQLATNALLGLLATVWTWTPRRFTASCLLGLAISGGFVLAWWLRSLYGGSMQGTTSAAAGVAGMDPAVLLVHALALLFAWLAVAAVRSRQA